MTQSYVGHPYMMLVTYLASRQHHDVTKIVRVWQEYRGRFFANNS